MPKGRQTCTECSMRRQKCDRNLPCGRCVRRGNADKCTREWGEDGYDAKLHRVYPRPDAKSATDKEHVSPLSWTGPSTDISPTSAADIHPSLRSTDDVIDAGHHEVRSGQRSRTTHQQSFAQHEGYNGNNSIVSPWQRTSSADSNGGLRTQDLLEEPFQYHGVTQDPNDKLDIQTGNGFGGTGPAQISYMQLLLPSHRQIFQLLEYHIDQVMWFHGLFHGPTFRGELQRAVQEGLDISKLDFRWTALLFSIMAGSMTCASDDLVSSWGFERLDRAKLIRQWYGATQSNLALADYTRRLHQNSVSAIAVLTLSAHVLGLSSTQGALIASAVRVAVGLGLHKLAATSEDTIVTDTARLRDAAWRDSTVQREIGRRVWFQLCMQDWFATPFHDMYSIQKLHFTSSMPFNINEETLQITPSHIPTLSSYTNFVVSLASLLPELNDKVLGADTIVAKYDFVKEYDNKVHVLCEQRVPRFLNMREAIDPSWPEWVPWARRNLLICYYHKILMIHRPFLAQSFTQPAFEFTRRACISAAKILLKEAKQAYDDEGPNIWVDQAFMVAAGITLALDIFHRKETEPELNEHKGLVQTTINVLGQFDYSLIATRGQKLLTTLLTEHARLATNSAGPNLRKHTMAEVHAENIGQGKRQKFDVPKFVERFVGPDSFSKSLGNRPPDTSFGSRHTTGCIWAPSTQQEQDQVFQQQQELNQSEPLQPNDLQNTKGWHQDRIAFGDFREPPEALTRGRPPGPDDFGWSTPGYEKFEQLFPPQSGISNNFLFEDLLNFDIF